MKRVRVQFTKGAVLTLLLLILSLVYFARAGKAYYEYGRATPLAKLRFEDCAEGRFVYGHIDSYVVSHVADDYYNGVSNSFILGAGAEIADLYTVPIADNKYIGFYVVENAEKELLEKFNMGKGEGVYIEGKILKDSDAINYAWVDDIEGFDLETIDEVIKPDYVIKQIDIGEEKKAIFPGISFLITAIVCYIGFGGVKNFIVQDTMENENAQRKTEKFHREVRYNTQGELEHEKWKLEKLQKRVHDMKISGSCCVVMLAFAIPLFWWGMLQLPIAVVVFYYCVKEMWSGFINSGHGLAKRVARLFNVETLQDEIAGCRYRMQRLNEMIAQEEL